MVLGLQPFTDRVGDGPRLDAAAGGELMAVHRGVAVALGARALEAAGTLFITTKYHSNSYCCCCCYYYCFNEFYPFSVLTLFFFFGPLMWWWNCERRVIWLDDADAATGYAVDFLSISLHAVSRDPEAYPKPCIYTQIETEVVEDETLRIQILNGGMILS